jgi:hypothetical protein
MWNNTEPQTHTRRIFDRAFPDAAISPGRPLRPRRVVASQYEQAASPDTAEIGAIEHVSHDPAAPHYPLDRHDHELGSEGGKEPKSLDRLAKSACHLTRFVAAPLDVSGADAMHS